MLAKDILVYHVIKRVQTPFESFKQGLKTLGVLEKIQAYPEAFCNILCKKPENLSAKILSDLFTVHTIPGVQALGFWNSYLETVEDGKSTTTLEDILLLQLVAVQFHLLDLNQLLQLSAFLWIFPLETSVITAWLFQSPIHIKNFKKIWTSP